MIKFRKILFLLFLFLPSISLAASISNISSTSNQLKFQLSSKVKYRVFTTSKPNNLVVEFHDTNLKFDLNKVSSPIFSSAKKSLNSHKQLRITFALKSPVKVAKSAIAGSKGKYYLTINLSSKLPVSAKKPSPIATIKQNINDPLGEFIDQKIGGEPVKASIPTSSKPVVQTLNKPKRIPVIVIDAGHGGKDPGTIGKFARSREKFVTLGYARELKRQLDKTKKYRVYLTRNSDVFIPLGGRVMISRNKKADLFISLHADASPDRDTYGLSIYTLSDSSSDKQAALLAQKENKSDIIGGADFSDASGDILKTLINLSQRSTMNESAKFAEIAIRSIRESKVTTLQRTHRFAGFRVLTAPDVPSVLIELGYLSNKHEEKRLNSLHHKRQVSQALVKAIDRYFDFIK